MHALDVVEIAGALTILLAYTGAQTGRLQQRTWTYQLLNLTGSTILAAIAATQSSWGFLLLEGSWAVVSFLGVISIRRGARREPARSS